MFCTLIHSVSECDGLCEPETLHGFALEGWRLIYAAASTFLHKDMFEAPDNGTKNLLVIRPQQKQNVLFMKGLVSGRCCRHYGTSGSSRSDFMCEKLYIVSLYVSSVSSP